jgi:hypothetical protein
VREPLDIDREMPVVLDREAAMARLLDLLAPGAADTVWDEIIAPLYDARAMAREWRRGRCIRCSAVHPGNEWELKRYPGRTSDATAHQQRCPKYVGPLRHHLGNGYMGFLGWRRTCSCGESWYEFDEEGNRRDCPKASESWRGPAAGEGGEQR